MNTNTTDIKSKVEVTLIFENGFTMSEKLRNEILELVTDIFPALDEHMVFTMQDLCGDMYWLSKSIPERIVLGKCMAYLVDHDHLPFDFADPSCRTPKRYRLNRHL